MNGGKSMKIVLTLECEKLCSLGINVTLLEGAKSSARSASTQLSLPTVPGQTINAVHDNYGKCHGNSNTDTDDGE